MNGMEYMGLFALQIALPGIFAPYFSLAAASYFWQQAGTSTSLGQRLVAFSGLLSSVVMLAGVLLFFGGILSGYDRAAGGAFNPRPDNWGVNYGMLTILGGIFVLWPITLIAMGVKAGVDYARKYRAT